MDANGRIPRQPSLDWLRGLVMVLMLLDHMRDFLHGASLWHDPTDLSAASTAVFLTRWITHVCAPVFVLLAGLGIHLLGQRGRSPAAVRRFLWTRGIWLILCEFTLVRLGMAFKLEPGFLGTAQVIWVLGVSMLLLALLLRLPRGWVLAFGLVLVVGHNLLDSGPVAAWMIRSSNIGSSLWILLHQGGLLHPFGAQGPSVFVLYPLLPWPGVMALGYALGPVFDGEAPVRRRWLFALGLACVGAFVLLRALDVYGDPRPWSLQGSGLRTVLSFLNTCKYPPSLLFLLMTLGPGLLILAWREGRASGPLGRMLETFGKVPMFFYLLQWPTAHGLGLLFHRLAGKPPIDLFGAPSRQSGFDLGVVYLAWGLGLLLLYPLCRWFAGVKGRRREVWLSYL